MFEIFYEGKKVLPPKYGGEHFDSDCNIKIKNKYLLSALKKLTVFEEDKSEKRFFDYSSLNVELIGNIYEGTMSLIFDADKKDVSIKKIKKKTGTEVHSTGTTYTPPNVVKYLLEEAFPKKLNRIPTICDPACGSGHFLIQALRILSERISFDLTGAETLQEHKRIIAKSSIFGTDINKLAGKLARLMIALETADKGKTAVNFDENIKDFNALTTKWNGSSDWIYQFPEMKRKKTKGFDFIVGNPPYVRADEPGEEDNRAKIKNSKQYSYLHKKWDLFIPFIELALGLTEKQKGIVSLCPYDRAA